MYSQVGFRLIKPWVSTRGFFVPRKKVGRKFGCCYKSRIFVKHLQQKPTTMKTKNYIEFTKQSGEIIMTEEYATELQAQDAFDEISQIRWPMTYKGIQIDASEWYPGDQRGTMRLVVVDQADGARYVRRELNRK